MAYFDSALEARNLEVEFVDSGASEALEGKQILFVPSGAKGAALQTMNVNELISRYAAVRVDEERGRSVRPAVERPK